jgi:hypothetical protein
LNGLLRVNMGAKLFEVFEHRCSEAVLDRSQSITRREVVEVLARETPLWNPYLWLVSLSTLMFVTSSLSVAQAPDSLPPIGAQVRVRVLRLGPDWQLGIFNQLRLRVPCYRVLLLTPEGRIVEMLAPDELQQLQVAVSPDGRIRLDQPEERGRPVGARRWREVPLSRFAASARVCHAYLDARSARRRDGRAGLPNQRMQLGGRSHRRAPVRAGAPARDGP